MDVTGIANVATTLADVGTSQAVSIAVLKKQWISRLKTLPH
jgi:hypothetical protein